MPKMGRVNVNAHTQVVLLRGEAMWSDAEMRIVYAVCVKRRCHSVKVVPVSIVAPNHTLK